MTKQPQAFTGNASSMSMVGSFDGLHDLTVAQAARQVRERAISPVDLIEALFERIDALEPTLGAWITLDRDGALKAARLLENDLDRGGGGLLCGVPVGIKDIFYTAHLKTTAASPLYAEFVPNYDATCVVRLRAEGAIVLGKTMTTQFASGDPTTTRNPWDSRYNPGGSSTGSAVAVATRMCPAALGSQTGGSTLRPASYNGVVGFKPTYGRISKYGVIPLAWTLDTVGIFVRTVEDAAIMLHVMAGYDAKDPSSSHHPVDEYRDGITNIRKRPRIGLLREYFLGESDKETHTHIEYIVELLSRKGADIEEVELPQSFHDSSVIGDMISGPEVAAFHEEAIRNTPQLYAPRLRRSAEAGMIVPAVTYLQAQRLRYGLKNDMEAVTRRFDALLTPTTPTPPQPELSTTGDPKFQRPWTLIGFPTISLPSGLSKDGLPMGIQLISNSFAELRLLSTALWCETALDMKHVPPQCVG